MTDLLMKIEEARRLAFGENEAPTIERLSAFLSIMALIHDNNRSPGEKLSAISIEAMQRKQFAGTTAGPIPNIFDTGQRCQHTESLQCVMYQHDPDISSHRYDTTDIPGETVGSSMHWSDACIPRETIEALAADWESQRNSGNMSFLYAAGKLCDMLPREKPRCPIMYSPGPGKDMQQCLHDEHGPNIAHLFEPNQP